GVASIVGPLLGGVLTDHVSWRWVFYINLPFGALAMALIASALDRGAPTGRRPVIDYWGVALFAAGVSTLLLGLVEAGSTGAWDSLGVAGPVVFAVACLTA